MKSFLIPFLSIALAELGDKTQLAIVLLSAKTSKRLSLFLGTVLAFFLADGSAILAGSWITRVIPILWIKIFSGSLFIFFGILTLRAKAEDADSETATARDPFWLGFSAVFFAELGDKTQIASALFATQYPWPGVLAGAMTALALLSLTAVYAGQWIASKVRPALLKKAAGILFIIMGCSFLLF